MAPGGSFSLPDHPAIEQGIRDAFAAGRIRPVQIDTVDFALGQGRLTVNGVAVPIDRPQVAQALTETGGWGGAIGTSALGGARLGAGLAIAVDAIQILADPDAHPDAVRELATTGLLGGVSGGTGAAIESALAPIVGRTLGGAVGGGLAAPVVTLGQMALSDQQYTAEDYEAKGARTLASGAFGGFGAGLSSPQGS
jgi:hypothetical protein